MTNFFTNLNTHDTELEHLGIMPYNFEFKDRYDPDDLTPMEVLVLTVYGEARGSSDKVIRYVTHVILNRIAERRSDIYTIAMNPTQFNTWGQFDDDHKSNYRSMFNPNQSSLSKVYELVKGVVKRRANGINPIPGVQNFTATRTLLLKDKNGITFVDDVRTGPNWPKGMEVVYYDDLAFLKRAT